MVVLGALPGCILLRSTHQQLPAVAGRFMHPGKKQRRCVVANAPDERGPCDVPCEMLKALVERDYAVQSQVLGTGMTGSVLLASHRRSGEEAAVKSFRRDELSFAALADLGREVAILRDLSHPHIASLRAVYDLGNQVSLVMERLCGGEVFDYIVANGRYSESAAAKSLRQMLSAVDYLHRRSIVHADLKPENFVYRDRAQRHVCLIDLGLARICRDGRVHACMGSLDYMAPEVLRGDFDCKADMWSMGVVAYAMLCGSTPWVEDRVETERLISMGRPRYCASLFGALSTSARDFVQSLLRSEHQRPTAEDASAHPWICARVPQVSSQQSMDGIQFRKSASLVKEGSHVSRSTDAGSVTSSVVAQGDSADVDDLQ